MSRSRTIIAGAVATLLCLALGACTDRQPVGGAVGAGGEGKTGEPSATSTFITQAVGGKDPSRQGPAADVPGATTGGTITVYLPGAPGPDTMDPAGAWSVTGNAIQQALVSRSLTQYARDDDGRSVLVPDLATDLGRHNDDFTEWTFTIRDDATWEDGSPVTPEEVAFGICRTLDAEVFRTGPGTEYSTPNFAGGADYQGPYTGDDPDCDDWDGITVDGQDLTIRMSRPFPDMDYWGAVMAMGPAPLGAASDPPDYGHQPLSTGPYRVESWAPGESLVLVRNEHWAASSDPARHQYAERWVFKFSQDQDKVDEIMLSGSTAGRAAVSTSLGAIHYDEARQVLGKRLSQEPSQCVAVLAPDYTKITDIRVRKALAYAYPYVDAWLARGEVPGVTRVPAGSVLPPSFVGRRDFQVDGAQITYRPAKARRLLAAAGYTEDGPYEITMAYDELDPRARAVQDQITTGFEAGGFSVRAIPVQGSPYPVWLDPDNAVNRLLNVRGASWCPLWPTGSAMLPPLLKGGAPYNTAHFDEPTVDREMERIATLPADEQADAWGDLDEEIMDRYFPVIPIGYVNQLLAFGPDIGHPVGDASAGAPDYKSLYVVQ